MSGPEHAALEQRFRASGSSDDRAPSGHVPSGHVPSGIAPSGRAPSGRAPQSNARASAAPAMGASRCVSSIRPRNRPAEGGILETLLPASPPLADEGRLAPYFDRARRASEHAWLAADGTAAPADFIPWWEAPLRQPLAGKRQPLPVRVDRLVDAAVAYSPQVQALLTEPEIREAQITQEVAAFDWLSFLETQYDDINEPIGNTLTTGNDADRFKDRQWELTAGLRRRTESGGELEVSQRLRRQQNNSTFLVPNPQANSRLEISFMQPLLRGAGAAYNQSRVILASLGAEVVRDEVARQLQTHVLRVAEAYWELYRARAQLLQRQRLLREADQILGNLEARQAVDALQRQVYRARAAVAQRHAEIARAENDIRNAEARLRFLVNAPDLVEDVALELLPLDSPPQAWPQISVRASLLTALQQRADIGAALREINAAMIRLGLAKQDLLPRLDLLLNTRVDGLAGGSELDDSLGDQFDEGRPTFGVGFNFEFPLGNRLSRAQQEQRQWEAQRAMRRFDQTVTQILLEVEVAAREVLTGERELAGRYRSLTAAEEEVEYLADRWMTLPGADDSATLLLENLLDAQVRRTAEEAAYVEAQVRYAQAIVELQHEMGILLRVAPAGVQETERRELEEVPAGASSRLPVDRRDTPQGRSFTGSAILGKR